MPDELAALQALQNFDLEILHYQQDLENIPKALEENRSDVAVVAELLEREKARLAEAEQWRADRERDIALNNELLQKSKLKLQGARNEKEANAAQREIDTIKRTIQEREEEALKVLEAIEQYRGAIATHTEEFEQLEQHLKEMEAEGEAKMAEARHQLAETSQRRAELAGRVPQKTLRLYERIHTRLSQALSEAAEGRCTACNIALPPQMFNEILRGDKLFQCPNCSRIMVHTPPAQEADTPPADESAQQ